MTLWIHHPHWVSCQALNLQIYSITTPSHWILRGTNLNINNNIGRNLRLCSTLHCRTPYNFVIFPSPLKIFLPPFPNRTADMNPEPPDGTANIEYHRGASVAGSPFKGKFFFFFLIEFDNSVNKQTNHDVLRPIMSHSQPTVKLNTAKSTATATRLLQKLPTLRPVSLKCDTSANNVAKVSQDSEIWETM